MDKITSIRILNAALYAVAFHYLLGEVLLEGYLQIGHDLSIGITLVCWVIYCLVALPGIFRAAISTES